MSTLVELAPRFLASESRVVSIGGGHGLAATLEALRLIGHFPIGVVSVADDGGSSGRLRETLGQIPPGDLRRCLSSLLPNNSPWKDLLEFRFGDGELKGHALGNLVFAGLNSLLEDSLVAAVRLATLVGCEGMVFPSCLDPVTLIGLSRTEEISGQVDVAKTSGILQMRIEPETPRVDEAVLEAIASATTITFGPGSLFTSILAVCKIPAIRAGLERAQGVKILVANLANEIGEAEGMALVSHVESLAELGIVLDAVLYDDTSIEIGARQARGASCQWIKDELARPDGRTHDTALLAKALMSLVV